MGANGEGTWNSAAGQCEGWGSGCAADAALRQRARRGRLGLRGSPRVADAAYWQRWQGTCPPYGLRP